MCLLIHQAIALLAVIVYLASMFIPISSINNYILQQKSLIISAAGAFVWFLYDLFKEKNKKDRYYKLMKIIQVIYILVSLSIIYA